MAETSKKGKRGTKEAHREAGNASQGEGSADRQSLATRGKGQGEGGLKVVARRGLQQEREKQC